MKVKDHNKYRLFDYTNKPNTDFELGQVLFKEDALDPINEGKCNPIGVVIQTHDDRDCRTDMYGNVSPSEVRLATYNEILQYRPELIPELDDEETDLFENYAELPTEVQAVLDKFAAADDTYENCKNLVAELNAVGYTCEYYLDVAPYGLRKL